MSSFRPIFLILICLAVVSCSRENYAGSMRLVEVFKMHTLGESELKEPIIFSSDHLPTYLMDMVGFSQRESYGRWTDKKIAKILFSGFLPNSFVLSIEASAFGDNARLPAQISACNVKHELSINAGVGNPAKFSLKFSGVETCNMISIEVPKPTSPKSINSGEDIRPLGYNFVSLGIQPE